jgi:HEAT repeat protein
VGERAVTTLIAEVNSDSKQAARTPARRTTHERSRDCSSPNEDFRVRGHERPAAFCRRYAGAKAEFMDMLPSSGCALSTPQAGGRMHSPRAIPRVRAAVLLVGALSASAAPALAGDRRPKAGPSPARAELLRTLAGLADASPSIRASAARSAGALHHPLFVDPVRGLLLASEPEVRRAACLALGDLGIPRRTSDLFALVAALKAATRDADDTVAEAAIESLARYPFPEVRLGLAKIAGDSKSPALRRRAATRALATRIEAESKERLESWLAITAAETGEERKLDEYEDRFGVAPDPLLAAARDLLDPDAKHSEAAAAIAKSGEPAERLPFLKRAIWEKDVAVRRIAADALASSDDEAFVVALVPASRDPDVRVRGSAIVGLAKSRSAEVTRALADRLRDERQRDLRDKIASLLAAAPEGDLLACVAAWDQTRVRDDVRRDLTAIVGAKSSTAAADLLAVIASSAQREDVAEQALVALRARADRQAIPAVLGGLSKTAPGSKARARLIRAIEGRRDPRITQALVHLAETGDPAVESILAILKSQPDARPALLRLAQSRDAFVRRLAFRGLEREKGEDLVEVLRATLGEYPEEDAAFALLLEQDKALILGPLLNLLSEDRQAKRREAILRALRGQRDPRIAPPVAASALASPDLAPIAIDVIRGQPESAAVPALAALAEARQLGESSRATALRAMADYGSEEVTSLVRPLAKDSELDVRMAARNALHTLDPGVYPRWDPYGRIPLVIEAAAFGAGMMLLASDIAQASLSPAFTGAVGMVLGGATPFLLTLNEDVTLGDAGFFGTVAAWGTLAGWGLGGSLQLSDQNVRWATLGGEIAGLAIAGLAMKGAEWSFEEVALTNFSGVEAGIVTGSLYALAIDAGGGEVDGRRSAYAGLLGGAVATVPIALLARRLRVDGNLLAISTSMAYGAWLGAFAPGVVSDKGLGASRAFAGIVAGQGIGYFAGLALSQFGELSPRSTELSALGGLAGAAMLSGLALSIDGVGDRVGFGLLESGTAVGALTIGILAPKLEFHSNDTEVLILSMLGGAIAGGQLSVRLEEHSFGERSFPGGVLLGAGAGTFAGLILSQLVDVSDKTLSTTLLGGGVLGLAGTGLGYMVPDLGVRPRSSITSIGIVSGLLMTAPFAEKLRLDNGNLGYAALTGTALGFWSAFSPIYWQPIDDARPLPMAQVGGAMAFGSALGVAAGTVISQALSLDTHALGVSTLGAAAGTALGGGFALLAPELDGRTGVAIMQATGLAGLAGFTVLSQLAPPSVLGGSGGDDSTLATHVAAFTLHGAWHGALIPLVRRSGAADANEIGGGVLFGAGFGSLAGVAALQLLDRPLEAPDLLEATVLAAAANGIGAGTGMIARDRRLGAGLMEGLGLPGYALALLAAPHTAYSAKDAETFLFTMGTLGWIGGWLPSTFRGAQPTGEQSLGGVLAGASLGLVAGSLYTQLAPEREELEMSAMTAASAGLGGGFGLLFEGIDDHGAIALMEATTALGLGASVLLAPSTRYTRGDLALLALTTSAGTWHGVWSVRALRSPGEPTDRQHAGGLAFGSSLGLLSGMAISQLIDPEPTDVLKVGLLSTSANAIGGGLALSLGSARAQDSARAIELSGLGGLAAFSLIAPHMEFETRDSTMIGLVAAAGAWHGALLPRLWSSAPTDAQRGGGAVLGLGLGALTGAAIAQVGHLDYEDQAEALSYALAANAVGGGLGLLAPGVGDDGAALLIDGIGIGTLALSMALSPLTSYSSDDLTLVGVGAGFGAWQGLWLPALFFDPAKPIPDKATGGGAMFGFGVGAIASGILAQVVELDAGEQMKASVPYLFASSIGAGAGLLAPTFDRRETVALMEGAGIVGLATGLALAKSTDYEAGDAGLVGVGTAVGVGLGLTLPGVFRLETGDKDSSTQIGGGALLGADLLGIGAATLAQFTSYGWNDVKEIAGLSLVGAGLGYGLGRMLPQSDSQLQLALLDGGTLVALAAALSFAPAIDVRRDDAMTFAFTGAIGAFMGGLFPALWNGSSLSSTPPAQVGGGLLFGASAGVASGLLLSQVTTIDAERRQYTAVGAGVGALSGGGLGLLFSKDDRVAVSLVEGLTLAGSLGLGLTGPKISYGAKDVALGTAYVGYLGWHTMGLTLLLEGTDRQAAGAAMATVGLGAVTGMYLAPYIDLNLSKALMLLAGNVWGTWIGGWGGAILRDHLSHDLGGRRSAGLTLVSSVLGSDVGLAVTGLVVGGLLDVKPTRFAVINLSGLGGMMIGMLAAGFAREQPLKAGNVIGSLGGLVLGAVVTSFFDFDESPTWDELLASAPGAAPTDGAAKAGGSGPVARSSAVPVGIDSWFPSAHVAPGILGEQEYLFTVMGTWH